MESAVNPAVAQGVTTRRIRRRAAIYRGHRAEALAVQQATSLDEALALTARLGKSELELRDSLASSLSECWRNLASRKAEVRRIPHMRNYHVRFAIGELAVIRLGRPILQQLNARLEGEPAAYLGTRGS